MTMITNQILASNAHKYIKLATKFLLKTLYYLIFNRAVLVSIPFFLVAFLDKGLEIIGFIGSLNFSAYLYSYIPEIILRVIFRKHCKKKQIIFWYKFCAHIFILSCIFIFIFSKPLQQYMPYIYNRYILYILILPYITFNYIWQCGIINSDHLCHSAKEAMQIFWLSMQQLLQKILFLLNKIEL
jgi:glucose-6-phosphate-specific signal transduction histidine kinase